MPLRTRQSHRDAGTTWPPCDHPGVLCDRIRGYGTDGLRFPHPSYVGPGRAWKRAVRHCTHCDALVSRARARWSTFVAYQKPLLWDPYCPRCARRHPELVREEDRAPRRR